MYAVKSYLAYQNDEEVKSKEELLLKAYERIIEKLNIAALAIEENRVKEKAESISKVTDAISVLKSSLDFENGGEIAEKLDSLYEFCLLELLRANLENDVEKVKNVKSIIETIYSGFKEAVFKEKRVEK